jgi:hypothetical protein
MVMMDGKVIEQREHKVMEAMPLKHHIHLAWMWRRGGIYFLQRALFHDGITSR